MSERFLLKDLCRYTKLRLIAPKGLIEPGISVSVGESQKGKVVSKRTHRGFELTYIIRGKHRFRCGSEEHELNGGDLIHFDGRTPHSVTASEPIQFVSVYFRDQG